MIINSQIAGPIMITLMAAIMVTLITAMAQELETAIIATKVTIINKTIKIKNLETRKLPQVLQS